MKKTIIIHAVAHVAQSVEHILGKDEVTGSIPVMGFPEWTRIKRSKIKGKGLTTTRGRRDGKG